MGAGSRDGSSWENAMSGADLAARLNAVSADSGKNYEFWVASGDYKPTTDADRAKSFTLSKGVKLYGGFAGNETALASRDIKANATYLSGEIGGSGNTDNSHHVVYASGNMGAETRLDGFTITGGYANDVVDYIGMTSGHGGGMYTIGASPTVANCVFEGNTAAGNTASYGGGMYNSGASPTVENCTFTGNSAIDGRNNNSFGGGMCNNASNPVLTNCTFAGNSATIEGGGMYNSNNSSPVAVNCTFNGNSAGYGYGMYNKDSNPVVANCVFWDNNENNSHPEIYNWGGNPTITNCVVKDGSIVDNRATTTSANIITADPVLGNLADNGGPVPTIQISAGGGAYRAGLAPGERSSNGKAFTIPAADARGVAFDTTSADIGAYSYVAESVKTAVESVTLDRTNIVMAVGGSDKLTATVMPETAKDKSVVWTSDAAAIAAVDESGTISAASAGKATITATAADGSGKSASCIVTVRKAAGGDPETPAVTPEVTKHEIVRPAEIDLAENTAGYVTSAGGQDGVISVTGFTDETTAVGAAGELTAADAIVKSAVDDVIANNPAISKDVACTLPIVESSADKAGQLHAISFKVSGDIFGEVADVTGISVLKVFPDGKGELFTPVTASGDIADKTVALYDGGNAMVTEAVDGSASYILTAFVKDGGTFDLDGQEDGRVIDPISIIKAKAAPPKPKPASEGGSCDTGAGALALLALAPLAMRKKKR